MKSWILVCLLLLLAVPCGGMELDGVLIQESIRTENGAELKLNGAGIREKFFFDIYLAAIYSEKTGTSASDVIVPDVNKRILMHFLYSKVEKEKLVDAWNEGFAANLSKESLTELAPKIKSFNSMFQDATKGDVILLDYGPATGTLVTINGEKKGEVAGKEFFDALLQIWLGDEPVTSGLKKALLAGAN